MRNPAFIAVILLCVVFLIGGLIIFSMTYAPSVPVYQTENITRITFHTHRPPFGEHEVPAEYMDEITVWLGSFTILHKADSTDIPAGANGVAVEIEYADGTVIYHGLNYPTIDGVTYRVRHEDYPACYYEILELNN